MATLESLTRDIAKLDFNPQRLTRAEVEAMDTDDQVHALFRGLCGFPDLSIDGRTAAFEVQAQIDGPIKQR